MILWVNYTSIKFFLKILSRNSLVVQGLGLCYSTAGSLGSVPGGGTKILQASHLGQKKKKKNDSLLHQTLKKFKEKN